MLVNISGTEPRGTIFGDRIYSDDSDVATAAIHAGLIQRNQKATIKVYITGPRSSFANRRRHGIRSSRWVASSVPR